LGKAWTTDAPYRETLAKIQQHKQERCLVVEIEAAGMMAVAQFRDVPFGQIVYGGDDVSGSEWDNRAWQTRENIRENLFWLAAAIGMAIGASQYYLAGATTVVVLLVLWVFPVIERWIDNVMEGRTYEVVCLAGGDGLEQVDLMFKESGLNVDNVHHMRQGERIISTWRVHGSPKRHHELVEKLICTECVKEYSY